MSNRDCRLARMILVFTGAGVLLLTMVNAQQSGAMSAEVLQERVLSTQGRVDRAVERLRDHEGIDGHPVMVERVNSLVLGLRDVQDTLTALNRGAWGLAVSVMLLFVAQGISLYTWRSKR